MIALAKVKLIDATTTITDPRCIKEIRNSLRIKPTEVSKQKNLYAYKLLLKARRG